MKRRDMYHPCQMPAGTVMVRATPLEKEDEMGYLQLSAFPLYIPKNKQGIPAGYYSRNRFVDLLRRFSKKPDSIWFLADMLEG